MKALPAPSRHDARPTPIPLRPDPAVVNDNAMRSYSRAVISLGHNALSRSTLPHDFARQSWPSDRDVGLILRAAVPGPASVANTPAVAVIATAFLDALRPASAGADLLQRAISLSFDGAASIAVPNIAVPVAAFVSAGAPIPSVEAPTSPGARLGRHKLACIAMTSSEMLRSPAAEKLVRAVLVEAVGPALDAALFSNAPADDERPAGLFNGVAPLPPGASLIDNLVAVVSAVSVVAGNGPVAVITSPTLRVACGLLLPREPPFAVFSSATLPSGTIVAIALPALVSALGGPPQIDASTEAGVVAHTEPDHISIGGMTLKPVKSMFQSDSVALRLRWPLSWALRSSAGIAWIQG